MFKFNFSVEDANKNEKNTDFNEENTEKPECENLETVKTGLIDYEDLNEKMKSTEKEIHFKKMSLINENDELHNDNYIHYVDSYSVKLHNNDSLNNILNTHDLVPNKYEGGLKVWELSIDLARFIYNINQIDNIDIFKSNNVENFNHLKLIKSFLDFYSKKNERNKLELNILELGCGHSLPSLSLIKCIEENACKNDLELDIVIYLQDFNEEIIENISFENVKKFLQIEEQKTGGQKVKKTFKFVYGDWRIMKDKNLLPNKYFNIILTSETIYNKNNYKHLLNIFKDCLWVDESSQNSGIVLLSAKTYYFGCGGNLLEFLNLAGRPNKYNFRSSRSLIFSHNRKDKLITFLNDTKDAADNSYDDDKKFESISKEIIRMQPCSSIISL